VLGSWRAAGPEPARALAARNAMPVTGAATAGAAAPMLPRQPLPVTEAKATRLVAPRDAGFGDENIVAVARLYR
jgi:hypothetical protein